MGFHGLQCGNSMDGTAASSGMEHKANLFRVCRAIERRGAEAIDEEARENAAATEEKGKRLTEEEGEAVEVTEQEAVVV